MRKTISFLAICLCIVCITAHAEQLYQNDTYRFSFVVPDHCKVIEEESDAQSAAFSIYNTQNRTFVAYIRYRNTYEKGKLLDYRKTRKNLLSNNDTITIINEKPFYNLLRQDIQYSSLYKGDETYTKMLLKASSYICITCYYPLSQDAQQILDTFDNQTTFRGNLARVKQNAGSIAMCVYLSLLCFNRISHARQRVAMVIHPSFAHSAFAADRLHMARHAGNVIYTGYCVRYVAVLFQSQQISHVANRLYFLRYVSDIYFLST